jgi:hypothetical protein
MDQQGAFRSGVALRFLAPVNKQAAARIVQ